MGTPPPWSGNDRRSVGDTAWVEERGVRAERIGNPSPSFTRSFGDRSTPSVPIRHVLDEVWPTCPVAAVHPDPSANIQAD